MATAEILSLISTISYIVAGVAFVLAVFFWLFFKIPAVIGDLSGRTAKKSIARRRASNEKTGGKGYQSSATNVNRGKLTDTMQQSRKLKVTPKAEVNEEQFTDLTQMPETGLLETNKADVVDSQQTEMLDSNETDVLVDENETALLQDADQTLAKRKGGVKLTMLNEVILIHTEETI